MRLVTQVSALVSDNSHRRTTILRALNGASDYILEISQRSFHIKYVKVEKDILG